MAIDSDGAIELSRRVCFCGSNRAAECRCGGFANWWCRRVGRCDLGFCKVKITVAGSLPASLSDMMGSQSEKGREVHPRMVKDKEEAPCPRQLWFMECHSHIMLLVVSSHVSLCTLRHFRRAAEAISSPISVSLDGGGTPNYVQERCKRSLSQVIYNTYNMQ